MLYPSHFWPHKNHHMLMTAYGIYLSRRPEKPVDLVFYGALNDLANELKFAAKRMKLDKYIHFISYPSPKNESLLWNNCECLIFPSLNEDTFPCAIAKAFHIGKPVLCSDLKIMNDIAKDAVMYFDMRKPEEIANCIDTITSDADYKLTLKRIGRTFFNQIQRTDEDYPLAESCAEVLDDNKKAGHTSLSGIFEDGWMGGTCRLFFESSHENRYIELRVETPQWLPYDKITMTILNEKRIIDSLNVYRGNELTVRHALPRRAGYIDFLLAPLFQPVESEIESNDKRYLSLIFKDCCIVLNNIDRSLVTIK